MTIKGRLIICYDSLHGEWERRVELLSNSARRLGIDSTPIDAMQCDYSDLDNFEITNKDFFYAATPFNHELERSLFFRNATSFYSSIESPNLIFEATTELNAALLSAGVPMPKTIVEGTDDADLLRKYVDYVGGFPLILKVKGGSRGVGVIKVDSWQGLNSLADYLVSQNQSFILSQFIENRGAIRSIVLGDQVLCHVMRINPQNEFRCSSPKSKPTEKLVQSNRKLDEIAIAASKAVHFEFVGVDIIQDADGNYFVLEVNFPQDFVTPQQFTGIDIANAAVSYLKDKAERRP